MKIKIKEIYTYSNLLSLFRLFLAVPFWILLSNIDYGQNRIYTILLCLFAGVTDLLDGYLARRFNQITEFGKIIDPLADKVCVATIILQMYLTGMLDSVLLGFILGRDALIFVGGIIVTNKIGKVLPSNMLGKLTVLSVCFYILFLLFGFSKETVYHQILYFGIIGMIIISFFAYLIRAIEFIKSGKNESV